MFYSISADHNNNITDQETINNIKRRGASLARGEFDRQNSLNSSAREPLHKRNSVLDPTKLESSQTGGTKLINFFKSGFQLSKFKSKSKVNLQDKRQSLYNDSHSSKSEENIVGLDFDGYARSIRASSLVLNNSDPTLYTNTIVSGGDSIFKPVVHLGRGCAVQSVHPSIVSGQNHCFQIIKRLGPDGADNQPFHSININTDSYTKSQIVKSCSYNCPFTDVRSAAPRTCESVNIIRCTSAIQRNEWIMRIKKHINPNLEHIVRHEDSLKIWIQEGKNLIPKKRYFCEIRLDQILYGRTTIKVMNDMVFWGEEFEFTGLENVDIISVSIYRTGDGKRKRDKSELVALINLPCSEVLQNCYTEKWYSPSADLRASSDHLRFSHSKTVTSNLPSPDDVSKCVVDSTPTLRVKARYRPLEIIPTNCYIPLIDHIIEDNIPLVAALENHLKVKSKEEFVNTLILILQKKERHVAFLSDVVLMEVCRTGGLDDNLILRGNSMASKAMECYLKLVGEKYLYAILSDTIEEVTRKEIDCEVDPLRIQNLKDNSVIVHNQQRLLGLVKRVWIKIVHSSHLLPKDLKSVFSIIREQISTTRPAWTNSALMIDQVISSCLFLRFICPAIMSPFLFGLASEYSDKPCINRTLTLVAKCIQSLANFSQSYNGKEVYMSFLHEFLVSNTKEMHNFLSEISVTSFSSELLTAFTDDSSSQHSTTDDSVDFGYQLAELSYQLSFHLRGIPVKEYTPALTKVRSILENISKLFPNFESDRNVLSNNISKSMDFRSQIPVALNRTMVTSSSLLPIDRKTSILPSILFSPVLRTEDEEDFSFIPVKCSSLQKINIDSTFKPSNENYVDFECIDMQVYDEPYNENESQAKVKSISRILNEKEINDHWSQVVKESFSNTAPEYGYHCDTLNYTINSSGYESLNFPNRIQSDLETNLSNNSKDPDYQSLSLSRQQNSQKMAASRKPNIFKRIKKNSSATSVHLGPAEARASDPGNPGSSNICLSLNVSSTTIGSMENLSGSENNSLKISKSMSSVYQKKGSNTKLHQSSFTNDGPTYNSKSQENLDSSMTKLFRNSSKSLANSISSNIDLDSFVSNELTRLQLFFQFFQVGKPSSYQGNAVEQYKHKTIDENNLKGFLQKKGHFTRNDIITHTQGSYRLLKTIHKPGQLTTDQVIKSVMQINQRVQCCIKEEHLRKVSPGSEAALNRGQCDTRRTDQSSHDSVAMSTQSLPPPPTKYSKQSQKPHVTCAASQESNSAVNLSKSLTVHDVFDRY